MLHHDSSTSSSSAVTDSEEASSGMDVAYHEQQGEVLVIHVRCGKSQSFSLHLAGLVQIGEQLPEQTRHTYLGGMHSVLPSSF